MLRLGPSTLTNAETVEHQRRVVGATWEDRSARYCRILGVTPNPQYPQVASAFADTLGTLETLLDRVGFTFADVVRTWFIVDSILENYQDLNRVRSAFFASRGIAGEKLPASTAVGSPRRGRTPVIASVFAVQPRARAAQPEGDPLSVRPACSPLQGPAFAYGSAFSRGIELAGSRGARLSISGTASIDRRGCTRFVGDPAAQVEFTLDVVERMLGAHGMSFRDASGAVAYFRRPEDRVHACRLKARGLTAPCSNVVATVCRDDLLFELELEAQKEHG
jgi:enamine deaminase RidA (YjgF/YER057c/UK114 family)